MLVYPFLSAGVIIDFQDQEYASNWIFNKIKRPANWQVFLTLNHG